MPQTLFVTAMAALIAIICYTAPAPVLASLLIMACLALIASVILNGILIVVDVRAMNEVQRLGKLTDTDDIIRLLKNVSMQPNFRTLSPSHQREILSQIANQLGLRFPNHAIEQALEILTAVNQTGQDQTTIAGPTHAEGPPLLQTA